MMQNIVGKEYIKFLNEIKSRIFAARIQAIRSVNKELIKLYWDIGKSIVDRQQKYKWGDNVVGTLARDLQKSFPEVQGFSERNVWNMRRFYEEYKDKPFLQQAVAEIPWGHNLLIMEKISADNEREYYIKFSRDFGWSRNVLLNQIKANAYALSQRQKTHNFPKALPVHLAEQADESIYAGKMDFYLHLLDEQTKLKDENPSIGIILCADKDNIVVEYALRSIKKPVGVAEYYLTKKLPRYLAGKLPGVNALKTPIQEELK